MVRDEGWFALYLSRNEALCSHMESDIEAVSLLIEKFVYIKRQDKSDAKIRGLDLYDNVVITHSASVENKDSTWLMEIFHAFGDQFKNTELMST